jgi:hypothetical protein
MKYAGHVIAEEAVGQKDAAMMVSGQPISRRVASKHQHDQEPPTTRSAWVRKPPLQQRTYSIQL